VNTNNSNNPMGKKPTSTLLDKGIKILGMKSEGGVLRLNQKYYFYFQKKKTGKTEENELNERTVKN